MAACSCCAGLLPAGSQGSECLALSALLVTALPAPWLPALGAAGAPLGCYSPGTRACRISSSVLKGP